MLGPPSLLTSCMERMQPGCSEKGRVCEDTLVCPASSLCRSWPNTAPSEVTGALESCSCRRGGPTGPTPTDHMEGAHAGDADPSGVTAGWTDERGPHIEPVLCRGPGGGWGPSWVRAGIRVERHVGHFCHGGPSSPLLPPPPTQPLGLGLASPLLLTTTQSPGPQTSPAPLLSPPAPPLSHRAHHGHCILSLILSSPSS